MNMRVIFRRDATFLETHSYKYTYLFAFYINYELVSNRKNLFSFCTFFVRVSNRLLKWVPWEVELCLALKILSDSQHVVLIIEHSFKLESFLARSNKFQIYQFPASNEIISVLLGQQHLATRSRSAIFLNSIYLL